MRKSYDINLNHLAVFHSVATERSVTRGADRLLISQPAASKQLKLLERSLGAALFERNPKGVRLTPAGELLANHARRLFAIKADAERAMADFQGIARGSLSVGASTTIGIYMLPELFVEYRRRHPGIQLRVTIANAADVQEQLLDRSLDVGLTEAFVSDARLEARVFARDELIPILPPGHPLLKMRRISAALLCREPFVVRETDSTSPSTVEQALARKGLSVRPVMSLSSTEAIKRAVAAGVGVAVVSRLAVSLELEAHRLATVPVSDLSLSRPFHRLTVPGRSSPASDAFIKLLESRQIR
jgi:DNA-binding transcriptional LysR family regulator